MLWIAPLFLIVALCVRVEGWLDRGFVPLNNRFRAVGPHVQPSSLFLVCLPTTRSIRIELTALFSDQKRTRDSARKNLPFTDEEDEQLTNAVKACQEAKQHVSWTKIAAGMGGRSKEQCRRRWIRLVSLYPEKFTSVMEDGNFLFRKRDPNNSFWNKEEDEVLLTRIEEFQAARMRVSWVKIAEFIGTKDRVQCASRFSHLAYRSSLYQERVQNIQRDKEWLFRDMDSDWTEEEDELFLRTIRKFQAARKKLSHWQLAEVLGTRDALQCAHHWKSLMEHKPEKVADILPDKDILFLAAGDKFAPDEDARLLEAIRTFLSPTPQRVCWKTVAKAVKTRDRSQCFSRWNQLMQLRHRDDVMSEILQHQDVLFPWRTGKFTPEEDAKIVAGIRHFQAAKERVSWDTISDLVGTRTHSQCFGRWKTLRRMYSADYSDILADSEIIFRNSSSKVRFTIEEDEKIQSAIREFQAAKRPVDWSEVARKVRSRQSQECRVHWNFYIRYHASQVADILADHDMLFPKKDLVRKQRKEE